MRLTKRLFILFLALWLPVSVVAAGSVAASMSGAAAQELAPEAGAGCPQHSAEQIAADDYGNCHGCSFCQFACSALLAATLRPVPAGAGGLAVASATPAVQAFIPEKLQRPPLSL